MKSRSGSGTDPIFVLNAGSCSLKGALVTDDIVWQALVDWEEAQTTLTIDNTTEILEIQGHQDAIETLLDRIPTKNIAAAGHRVVHGGPNLIKPTTITPKILKEIEALNPLAPLHNPFSVAGIKGGMHHLPDIPHIAVFDTAFHHTLPEEIYTYPIPLNYREKGVRKYGFHGINYAHCARQIKKLAPKADRVICCHLGGGASICAMREGASQDTTMGLTPLDGLMMATRSGAIDPGVLLYLMEQEKLSPKAVGELLNHQSGFLALAKTADLREVYRKGETDDEAALLAIAIFWHRIAAAICSLTVSIGGLDALIFTGGIGENDPHTRLAVCNRLLHLGIEIDRAANENAEEGCISAKPSPISVWVIPAGEELEIARACRHMS